MEEAADGFASNRLQTCRISWATAFVLGDTGAYQKAWIVTGGTSNYCADYNHRKERDTPASQLTRTDHTIPADEANLNRAEITGVLVVKHQRSCYYLLEVGDGRVWTRGKRIDSTGRSQTEKEVGCSNSCL